MTERLRNALKAARHLRGPRVVSDGTGQPLTQRLVQGCMLRVARRANVKPRVHILRHTFCSHLAMQDLSPAAVEEGIRLLETGRRIAPRGDIVETADTGS
jgi:site-specific recombinase XerD